MFTGLVETTGALQRREPRGPGAWLEIGATFAGEPLAHGESILIDGACLSVVESRPGAFAVDATAESCDLGDGGRLNLERSLRAGDRLGGHLVTGHVDAVVTVVERRPVGEAECCDVHLPRFPRPALVAEKCLVGVSLTVNAVRAAQFDVMLIPVTLRLTTLDPRVNLEVDLVARYVARWLG